MSQPLIATYRITFSYTVLGLLHKFRAYCKPVAVGVQPWVLRDRNGAATALNWANIAFDAWRDYFANQYPPSVTGAAAVLENFQSPLWVPLDFTTIAQAGGSGDAINPTQQSTWVIRDTAFKKIRVIWLETTAPFLGHSANGLGLYVESTPVTHAYDGTVTVDQAPFQWQVSRGDRYVLAAGSVAGLTYDQNRKLKRARHDE